jgi:hypothetical protein
MIETIVSAGLPVFSGFWLDLLELVMAIVKFFGG